jgi:hypothetical protein
MEYGIKRLSVNKPKTKILTENQLKNPQEYE